MTKQTTQELQKIIDDAPDGATHIDNDGIYYKIETVHQYEDESDCGYEDRFRSTSLGGWIEDHEDLLLTRSLDDIREILELRKEVEARDKEISELKDRNTKGI